MPRSGNIKEKTGDADSCDAGVVLEWSANDQK
jgi:hypothetical protein